MAQYFVRIELHYASESDYQSLHKAMWNAGFRRFVRGDDNKMYLLPTASYVNTTDASLEELFNKAKAAADSTNKAFWIWIDQWVSAKWFLRVITADPDAESKANS